MKQLLIAVLLFTVMSCGSSKKEEMSFDPATVSMIAALHIEPSGDIQLSGLERFVGWADKLDTTTKKIRLVRDTAWYIPFVRQDYDTTKNAPKVDSLGKAVLIRDKKFIRKDSVYWDIGNKNLDSLISLLPPPFKSAKPKS